MAFTAIGSLGTAQVKNATPGTDPTLAVDITISPSRAVAVGRLVVIWLAADSIVDPAESGSSVLYTRMCCHDDEDNVYDTIAAGKVGATGSGAQGAIFISRLRNALTTSSVITVRTQQFPAGTTIARAISVEEFSIADGMIWATTTISSVGTLAADPAAISLSSLPSGYEYLWLHLLAAEGPETDTYTWDADYTQITGNGTTGGAADSNMHIRGGYRIASLTSDTVNVTSDTADRDYQQELVAIAEIPLDSSFPTAPLLDDFNRADVDPLNGVDWATDCSTVGSGAIRLCRILSLRCAAGVTGSHGGQWRVATYTGIDSEVYGTMAVAGWLQVILAGSGCANNGTADGIAALWRPLEADGMPIRQHIDCGQMGLTGEIIENRFLVWYNRIDGNKMGIQHRTDATHFWIDIGSGWEWTGAFLNFSTYDPSLYTGGKLGMVLGDAIVRLDDFGGGASDIFVPQIYRRVFG